MQDIYINSIKQISVQQPLSDAWFDAPMRYSDKYVHAIDPDFKQYIDVGSSRRMCKIIKRALTLSQQAMAAAHISMPDAIIAGTGHGCIECTESLLEKLIRQGENALSPTLFMQSTHNSMAAQIAIAIKCHAYNNTYSHKGISFECALRDAVMQLQSGRIRNALVGAFDELSQILDSHHVSIPNTAFVAETAAAMMLSTQANSNTLCKIDLVEKHYGSCNEFFANSVAAKLDADYVMVGTNGSMENDRIYMENCGRWFGRIPLLHYKHVFGESYTAPAFGVYAAALCLARQHVPDFLHTAHSMPQTMPAAKILCYSHVENKNHTFVLLSKS